MIQMPKRSVTRFFIPLIDVLTLLFCIFLLMPMVQSTGEARDSSAPSEPQTPRLTVEERKELEQLRQERKSALDLAKVEAEMKALQKGKRDLLEQGIAFVVLEIGEEGRLFFYDSTRSSNRRVEITKENVAEMIDAQKRQAQGREVYFLILYPRRANGFPGFPLQAQRQEYDRWFQDVTHKYDIPYRTP